MIRVVDVSCLLIDDSCIGCYLSDVQTTVECLSTFQKTEELGKIEHSVGDGCGGNLSHVNRSCLNC